MTQQNADGQDVKAHQGCGSLSRSRPRRRNRNIPANERSTTQRLGNRMKPFVASGRLVSRPLLRRPARSGPRHIPGRADAPPDSLPPSSSRATVRRVVPPKGGLTLSHWVSRDALMPLLRAHLKLAGSSFFDHSHEICQAAGPSPTTRLRRHLVRSCHMAFHNVKKTWDFP